MVIFPCLIILSRNKRVLNFLPTVVSGRLPASGNNPKKKKCGPPIFNLQLFDQCHRQSIMLNQFLCIANTYTVSAAHKSYRRKSLYFPESVLIVFAQSVPIDASNRVASRLVARVRGTRNTEFVIN